MGVQLLDLKAQYEKIKDEIRSAIDEVLENQHFILGPKVAQFEKNCANYLGAAHTLGVSSGSDALLLALMALDIKAGDKVITTPFSFFATAGCIARLGATPVFVDIDPDSYNISPEAIEQCLSQMSETDRKSVKAILPVHLYGQMADMERIMDIAEEYNLKVVEDAAQAFGAECIYRGEIKKAGTIGHIGCYSFFPSKNLGCYGDGGMVCCNTEELYSKMKILRVHGSSPKYYHKVIGGNFRLDEIQAAVLDVKLKYLDEWSKSRQKIAKMYTESIGNSDVIVPKCVVNTEFGHIYHQYVVRVKNRKAVEKTLDKEQIGHAVYYPLPLHIQECFKYLGYQEGNFPVAEGVAMDVLALPIYPELEEPQIKTVVRTVIGKS